MKRVVIFASGTGSNAENIINHFKNSKNIRIEKVFCNKQNAGIFIRCRRLNIACELFSRQSFSDPNKLLKKLLKQTDYIVLAGFLWKIPEFIITAFPNKIINIHPSLLPKYGGKGMYGMNVHKAVKEGGEKETGITIHYVNNQYDEGAIIFQAKTQIKFSDSPEEIARQIHKLEANYFPEIIEKIILKDEQ